MEEIYPQFQTLEEVREYLSGNTITCLVCGKEFQRLNCHVQKMHNLSADEYRLRFGIPLSRSLTSVISREKSAEAMERPERKAQFDAARQLPHGKGRPWLRGRVPAVTNHWKETRQKSHYRAHKLVIVQCPVCGCDVAATELCATQPVRCMKCTTPETRKWRRCYWKRKWAA